MSLHSHAGWVSGASVLATLPLPLLERTPGQDPGKGTLGPSGLICSLPLHVPSPILPSGLWILPGLGDADGNWRPELRGPGRGLLESRRPVGSRPIARGWAGMTEDLGVLS